ncbi:hypothetical protein LTR02_003930 [Friedmanniomyces endolithicus]|nr:hypothetical protein LTR94_010193 [Friedmanniomyces endolithicus]KAK0776909.1 hypothetical protein LTR59_014025 [Friedmanniomyces endolithicus]KAK0782306.1 hypothetical protein LTR38_013420 [Friedmanniomyces endolithicus]KAK0910320.1 hypothetical protein LTR02_003930 [Friedmanniomyces endolithicus]
MTSRTRVSNRSEKDFGFTDRSFPIRRASTDTRHLLKHPRLVTATLLLPSLGVLSATSYSPERAHWQQTELRDIRRRNYFIAKMSQPHEYSNSGRLRKKTVFFDDLQAEHQQKATAIKEERQVSGLGRMQNTQADNDLVSPNTPTPAPRISTASQHLPIPAATNSAPISPTTVPPIEVASKDTAAAPTRRIAETPVGGPSSGSKAMSSKPRVRAPASSGPQLSRVEKSKKKQPTILPPPLLHAPSRLDTNEAIFRAAALALPEIQRLREDPMLVEEEPPQIVYTRGRERPTGYGADWYGVVQPLFRGETHPPDGVQRHISMEEGETGSWDIDSGPEDDDELWASHRHFGEFVHGTSIDDGHRLTALEQAAGVGEDPMDAMMTSDEEV